MHLFEEEINLFIGYSRDLADFIPIDCISECSRCVESRHSPRCKKLSLLFLADVQLLSMFGTYLF